MTTLVVGASGATGRLLVDELLKRGESVRVVVRSTHTLSQEALSNEKLTVVTATLLDLSDDELSELTKGCDVVASCLGHNLSFKGLFGPPYRLVTNAARRLCASVQASEPSSTVKYILMNTTGNSNRDIPERVSFAQRCVVGLLRLLLPPHADNENAADYLRTEIGQSDRYIEWSVVRPDSLLDSPEPTDVTVHASPVRSAIFDAGVTSRINVAFFMADLALDEELWSKWKGQMPVIYNA